MSSAVALGMGLFFVAAFIATSLAVNDLLLSMTALGKLAQLYPESAPARARRSIVRIGTDLFHYWAWAAARPEGIYCGGLFWSRALVPMTRIKSVSRDDSFFVPRCRLDIDGLDTFLWISGAQTCQQIEAFWEAANQPE